jgi:type I restriction enzyme, S subunit
MIKQQSYKSWSLVSLEDLAISEKGSIRRGPFGGSLKKEIFVDEGYLVYEQQHAIADDFSLGRYFINEAKFKEMEGFNVLPDDLIISCAGTIGKIAIAPNDSRPGIVNQALMRIRPDQDKILPIYLKRYLESPIAQKEIFSKSSGSALKNLVAISEIKKSKIPLPPLEEQKRIVAILDKADRVRRKRQEAIRLTEELGRSIFLDMFGDPVTNSKGLEVKPLGDIATFLGGGTPARNNDQYFQGQICWASSKDMGNEILVNTQEHITQEAIDNCSTKIVPPGVLLVVVKSKILMRRLPVSRTAVNTCFNQDIKAIILKDLALTRYLQAHLKLGQETLLRQARGVNTEGLTLEHLRKYPVLMPKKESIEKFVATSKELEKMLVKSGESLQESENLFNSLLQRAFRGEL